MDPAFLALAQQCTQAAPVETLAAIAQVESGLNPFAIRLNSVRPGSPGIPRQPTSVAEATAKVKALVEAGNDVDLGLMGLPATVLSMLSSPRGNLRAKLPSARSPTRSAKNSSNVSAKNASLSSSSKTLFTTSKRKPSAT